MSRLSLEAKRTVEIALGAAIARRAGGDSQAAAQMLEAAAELLQRATELDKAERAALLQSLLEVQVEMQKWDAALNSSDELLQLAPRHHFALEARATAQLHSGRIDEAAQTLRALLQISPRDPLHRLKYATLLQLQDKSGEALREFARVAQSFPDAPFASDARDAIEMLDSMQIQQILMRASEQTYFRLELQRELDETLAQHGFDLSEAGRESLRHIVDDGRPPSENIAPRVH